MEDKTTLIFQVFLHHQGLLKKLCWTVTDIFFYQHLSTISTRYPPVLFADAL